MKKDAMKRLAFTLAAAVLAAGSQSCERKSPGHGAPDAAQGQGAGGPVLVRIVPERAPVGAVLRAIVQGPGDGLSLSWEKGGEALGASSDTIDTAGFRKGDTVKVVATLSGVQTSAEAVIVNSPPAVRSVAFGPGPLTGGRDVKAAVEGSDRDNDAVRYEYLWSVNGQAVYSETGPVLGGDRFVRGDVVSVMVTPFDGEAQGEPFEASAGAVENSAPRFTSAPPVEFSGSFVYRPEALDADGDAVAFAVVKGPEGMKAEGGVLEWDARGQKGAFEVTLSADDGSGGRALQTFELKVEK